MIINKLADVMGCVDDRCERLRQDGKPRKPPRPPCDYCVEIIMNILCELRDPSKEMIEAGVKAHGSYDVREAEFVTGWQAAIDEIVME